jgi:hypothetical protein
MACVRHSRLWAFERRIGRREDRIHGSTAAVGRSIGDMHFQQLSFATRCASHHVCSPSLAQTEYDEGLRGQQLIKRRRECTEAWDLTSDPVSSEMISSTEHSSQLNTNFCILGSGIVTAILDV